MKKTLFLTLFTLSLACPTPAQDDGGRPQKPVVKRPAPTPRDGAPDDAAAKDKAAQLTLMRMAFAEEYLTRKASAGDELAEARERTAGDEAAFAAARTEIARKYRGELATLRTAFAEKAKGLGLTLDLPADDAALEQMAVATAPATALRMEYSTKVAELARAASAELAIAQRETSRDPATFAAKRTEIARKYRGQVLALQQAYAQKAAGQGVTIDTSDVSKVMTALASDAPAPPQPEAKPRPVSPDTDDASQKPAEPNPPVDAPQADTSKPSVTGQPIDAVTLRTAFTKRVEELRQAAAGEIATAELRLKGAALAQKRLEITADYRGQIETLRQTCAARAMAAGVTMNLPSEVELAPELARPPEPPPKEAPEKKSGDEPVQKPGEAPSDKGAPKEGGDKTPPKDPVVGPGGKRGRGPRFGGGGGSSV